MMSLPKPSRLVSLLPILFFAIFLYGIREYGTVGGISDLTLAAAAGLLCLATVGALIYYHYERPRLCIYRRDHEKQA